jgi:hypothetical protein
MRFRSLTPAAGWFTVDGWVDTATDAVELLWKPVVAWAILQGEGAEDDDLLVPVVRFEGGPGLTTATDGDEPLGLHTEAERQDETVLAGLREEVRKKDAKTKAERQRMAEEQAAVFAFVKAQPDPVVFARRMREAGAQSLHHAALAIALAKGDAAQALRLADRSIVELQAQARGA